MTSQALIDPVINQEEYNIINNKEEYKRSKTKCIREIQIKKCDTEKDELNEVESKKNERNI